MNTFPLSFVWVVFALSPDCNYVTMAVYSHAPKQEEINRVARVAGEGSKTFVKKLRIDEVVE